MDAIELLYCSSYSLCTHLSVGYISALPTCYYSQLSTWLKENVISWEDLTRQVDYCTFTPLKTNIPLKIDGLQDDMSF